MAKKIGIVLALDGEQKFTQGMKNAAKEVSLMKTELKNVESEFKGEANTIEALTAKQKALSKVQEAYTRKLEAAEKGLKNAKESYSDQEEALKALEEALKEVKKEQADLEKSGKTSSDVYKNNLKDIKMLEDAIKQQGVEMLKSQGRITDWTEKVSKSENELKLANNALKKNESYLSEASDSAEQCATSIDKFGKEVRDTKDELGEAGEKALTFGDILKANISADLIVDGLKKVGEAAVEAGKYVVEVGSDFEQSMSEVEAISGSSGSQLDQMAAKAKKLGSSTKFSASEVAQGFKYMSLAGWSAQESIDGIDGVLNLAAASGMELAEASDMLTDYLSAFGLEAQDASKMADMMAYAQANSNTSVQQLGEAYQNCAANMHSAGQDIETTTSLLEAMANQGTKGSKAGTQLSAIMRDITAKMKDGKIAIGDTTVSVADANGNFRDLTDILKDVEAATYGMGNADKKAALQATFTADSINGLNLILSDGMKNVSGYETALRNCDGAAEEMSKIMNDNLKGDLTNMGSALEGLGIAAYNYIDGPARSVVQGVTGMISGITDAITPQKTIFENFVDEISKSNEEVEKLIKGSDSIIQKADLDTTSYTAYKDIILELNDVEEKNALQKFQMKSAVEALSGVVPGLTDAFNEESGSIEMTNSSLEKLLETSIETARRQALLKAEQELIDANAEAYVNLHKAKIADETATKELNDAYFEINKRISEGTKAEAAYDTYVSESGKTWGELTDQVEETGAALNIAQEQFDKTEAELQKLNDGLSESADKFGESATSTQGAVDEHIALKKAMQETGEAAQNTSDEFDDLNESLKNVDGAQVAKDAIESVKQKYQEFRTQLESDIQNKISLFDTFNGGTDITAENMLSNLQSQYEGLKNWEANMEYLSGYIGKEISPEFYNSLIEMGTDGANAVEHMVITLKNQGDEGAQIIKDISDTWTQNFEMSEGMSEKFSSARMALESFIGNIGSSDVDFSNLRDAIETQMSSAASGWSGFTDATRSQLEEALSIAEAVGIQIPQGLSENIANGEVDITGTIEALQSAIKGQFQGLAEIANEYGVELPKELSSAIESGEGLTTQSWADLCSALLNADIDTSAVKEQGKTVGEEFVSGASEADTSSFDLTDQIVEQAQESTGKLEEVGKSHGDAYISSVSGSISSGTGEVKAAVDSVASGIESATETFRAAGEESGKGYAEGISNGLEEAFAAAVEKSNKTAEVLKQAIDQFKQAGNESGNAYAQAILATRSQSSAAAQAVALAAKNAAASQVGGFSSIGYQMSAGLASGISSGSSLAISAAVSVAARALAAAKAEADIHSPSRKFRIEVGQMMSKGVAFGIRDSASLASNEASKMSNKVFKNASSWLKQYKKSHDVTISDTIYFWSEIVKHTKTGTNAYNKAIENINDAIVKSVSKKDNNGKKNKDPETYYSEIYRNAQSYVKNQIILNDMSTSNQIAYWKNLRKHLKSYSQAWIDATEQIKSLQESQRQETLSTQETIIDTYKTYKDAADAEIEYWESVVERAKKGTQEYVNAQKKLDEAKKKNLSLSLSAEMQYWNLARKQFKAGTEERIQADQKYYEARAEYYEELKELEEDYAEKTAEINKNKLDKIESAHQAYSEKIKSEQKSIMNQMNLFESWDAEGYDKNTILSNLEQQVKSMRLWADQLNKLRAKGLSKELLDELEAMGPEAAANLWSLNQMTQEELDKFQRMWNEKAAIAYDQAQKSDDDALAEMNKAIKEAESEAKNDLDSLEKVYRNALAKLNEGLTSELASLVTNAAKIGTAAVNALVQAIQNGNVSSVLQNTVTGTSTDKVMQIIKTGMKRSKTLTKEEKADHHALWEYLVSKYGYAPNNSIYTQLAKALGVKADSTVTKDQKNEILKALKKKGYAKGARKILEDQIAITQEAGREIMMSGSGAVTYLPKGSSVMPNKLSENMFDWGEINPSELIGTMRANMERQNARLQEQMSSLSFANINARLNERTAMAASIPKANNSGADFKQLMNVTEQMRKQLESISDDMHNMQIRLDTGALVGGLAPGLSRENASVQIRRQRGRF